MAAVPQDFGWIYEYDVQQALAASGAASVDHSRNGTR
jgi:hypothetical protein